MIAWLLATSEPQVSEVMYGYSRMPDFQKDPKTRSELLLGLIEVFHEANVKQAPYNPYVMFCFTMSCSALLNLRASIG